MKTILGKFFVLSIKLYQLLLSPFFGKNCIYHPTCSQYAIEAVRKHGVLKGYIAMTFRVLRCNARFTGGYDPVPQDITFRQMRALFKTFSHMKKKHK
ncbi:hypothetical protein LSH36_583g01161 [Paralvinella palmiformis]|uniref:Membrane protein insertion efficiency factor n=1 Tax=Paralvinella palmiformis TaxID=53620 RepID=A0AAD9J621_9ANNE|nr:hypothetical protein LSH36_583g01161 [Paralvinella palmiformis]